MQNEFKDHNRAEKNIYFYKNDSAMTEINSINTMTQKQVNFLDYYPIQHIELMQQSYNSSSNDINRYEFISPEKSTTKKAIFNNFGMMVHGKGRIDL